MIFAFDTSTRVLSAALVEGGTILARHDERSGGQHSLLLPAILARLCAEVRRSENDVTGIAVGLGPGSFTGLRVGVATAKGMAQGRRIPLAGCSSLAAMAAAAARAVPAGTLLAPTLDARRRQVYAGVYRATPDAIFPVTPVHSDRVLDPGELAALLARGEPVSLFGEGALAYPGVLRPTPTPEAPLTPPASGVAVMCAPTFGPYSLDEVVRLEPRYLRAPGADAR